MSKSTQISLENSARTSPTFAIWAADFSAHPVPGAVRYLSSIDSILSEFGQSCISTTVIILGNEDITVTAAFGRKFHGVQLTYLPTRLIGSAAVSRAIEHLFGSDQLVLIPAGTTLPRKSLKSFLHMLKAKPLEVAVESSASDTFLILPTASQGSNAAMILSTGAASRSFLELQSSIGPSRRSGKQFTGLHTIFGSLES